MSSLDSVNSFGSSPVSSPKSSPTKRHREGDSVSGSPSKKARKDSHKSTETDRVVDFSDAWFAGVQSSPSSSPEKKERAFSVGKPKTARRKLEYEDAMDIVKTSLAPQISELLKTALPERKPLSQCEREQLARQVEELLSSSTEARFVAGAPRDIVIDPARNRFIILSGKHGDLSIEGAERLVSAATAFSIDGDQIRTTRLAHLELIIDEDEEEHELNLQSFKKQIWLSEQINPEDQFFAIEYTNKSKITTMSAFELRYDDNIESAGAKRPFTSGEIVTILKQVANQLSFLHSNGLVHADLTKSNVLLKDDRTCARVIDFGNTYSMDESNTDWPKEVEGYGCIKYAAPEHFGVSKQLEGKENQNAAEDMFALGCLLYIMLFPKEHEIYWDREVSIAVQKKTEPLQRAAKTAYQKGMRMLVDKRKAEHAEDRQKLIDLCMALLHEIPEKRMTLPALQSFLG